MRFFESTCIHHGFTRFIRVTDGHRRCLKCRAESTAKRRDNIKLMAVEYKGGKCEKCGYSKCIQALDFHHLDPRQKDFSIASDGCTRGWARVKLEIDKCIMLCSNCHREVHALEHQKQKPT